MVTNANSFWLSCGSKNGSYRVFMHVPPKHLFAPRWAYIVYIVHCLKSTFMIKWYSDSDSHWFLLCDAISTGIAAMRIFEWKQEVPGSTSFKTQLSNPQIRSLNYTIFFPSKSETTAKQTNIIFIYFPNLKNMNMSQIVLHVMFKSARPSLWSITDWQNVIVRILYGVMDIFYSSNTLCQIV